MWYSCDDKMMIKLKSGIYAHTMRSEATLVVKLGLQKSSNKLLFLPTILSKRIEMTKKRASKLAGIHSCFNQHGLRLSGKANKTKARIIRDKSVYRLLEISQLPRTTETIKPANINKICRTSAKICLHPLTN